ncbi:hypothetical protein PHLGIDRAFT_366321 [Phlebiopsis gigantea 11061_1 CR5-6]|uniref:Uncharacterized protein n=1 Tax=Phlebiopsis gigantea (strain 11061_1 CR5-6) TaxID=745531 RepID=A0A0C3S0Z3_PHLG1|nr:hypothetical protein PHLGIDRAFT_366321 [Phlebiopsis gigantea 11061_1 CR5-6]
MSEAQDFGLAHSIWTPHPSSSSGDRVSSRLVSPIIGTSPIRLTVGTVPVQSNPTAGLGGKGNGRTYHGSGGQLTGVACPRTFYWLAVACPTASSAKHAFRTRVRRLLAGVVDSFTQTTVHPVLEHCFSGVRRAIGVKQTSPSVTQHAQDILPLTSPFARCAPSQRRCPRTAHGTANSNARRSASGRARSGAYRIFPTGLASGRGYCLS